MSIMVFGEAERGAYCTPVKCASLEQLFDVCGNQPEGSFGIFYAVQALLYNRPLIFFRVEEEGFSTSDYMQGFHWLRKKIVPLPLTAICLPGVGDDTIIHAAVPLCTIFGSLLVFSEKDLYDYLTSHRSIP